MAPTPTPAPPAVGHVVCGPEDEMEVEEAYATDAYTPSGHGNSAAAAPTPTFCHASPGVLLSSSSQYPDLLFLFGGNNDWLIRTVRPTSLQ